MNQAEKFYQLHHEEKLFVLGNAWDVASVRAFEEAGYKAVATSSAALANTLGYEDGEKIPFSLLFETVLRMKEKISVPFSVDLERGYGNNATEVIRNLEKLVEIGIAGINLEDSMPGEQKTLKSIPDFQLLISSISERFNRKGMKIFINARTDAFLLNIPNPLDESIKRVKAYEEAGANGVFVPLLTDETGIRQVVNSTNLPLNVLAWHALPDFEKLSALGVKRVSLGSSVFRQQQRLLSNRMSVIQNSGSVSSVFT